MYIYIVIDTQIKAPVMVFSRPEEALEEAGIPTFWKKILDRKGEVHGRMTRSVYRMEVDKEYLPTPLEPGEVPEGPPIDVEL